MSDRVRQRKTADGVLYFDPVEPSGKREPVGLVANIKRADRMAVATCDEGHPLAYVGTVKGYDLPLLAIVGKRHAAISYTDEGWLTLTAAVPTVTVFCRTCCASFEVDHVPGLAVGGRLRQLTTRRVDSTA